MRADEIIKDYDLQAHPEGGFYKESYRSSESLSASHLPSRFGGDRHFSTAIYFLLPQNHKSHLHKIKSDELWHFYEGDPLYIIEVRPNGDVIKTTLGPHKGQTYQYCVPAGTWFGSYSSGDYSFVGCTVAPGFDFADFEMAQQQELINQFPQLPEEVKDLCL